MPTEDAASPASLPAQTAVGVHASPAVSTSIVLEAVLQASPLPILVLDRLGRFLVVGEAVVRLLGFPALEIIGKTAADLGLEPNVATRLMDLTERVFQIKQPLTDTVLLPTPSGLRPYEQQFSPLFDEQGEVIAVLCIAQAMTTSPLAAVEQTLQQGVPATQQETEDALREQQERYQLIVENAQEGIWLLGSDATTEYVNPRMAQMLGYSVEEMLGRNAFEFVFPEDVTQYQDAYTKRKAVVSEQREVRGRKKDGSELWTLANANPILDAEGRFVGALALVTDLTERKRAEDQLKESERQFRAVFDNTAVGVALVTAEGRVFQANPAYGQMLGYSVQELVGKSYQELTYPADLEQTIALYQELLEGKRDEYTLETRYLRQDGSLMWAHLSVGVVRNGEGSLRFFVAVINDISARKEVEQQVRRSHEKLAYHFENTPLAVIEWDETGHVRHWSAGAERIFGWTAAELEGKHFDDWKFVYEADYEAAAEVAARLQEGRETRNFHYNRNYTKSGEVVDCEWYNSVLRGEDGKWMSMLSLALDVTERKRTEAQVKLLSTVAAESVNGIVITDPKQCILFVNPAFERLTGYTRDELLGQRPDEMLQGPDTDAETIRRVRACIDAQEAVTAELLNYRKDGTSYWCAMHITPVRDGRGEVTHFIAVETDTTQRKQTEMALRQSQESLMDAQAMAHVGSWERDYRNGTMSGSDELFRIYGLEPGSIPLSLEALLAHVHPLDVPLAQERMRQAMQEGKNADYEVRLVGPNGRLRYVHVRAKILTDASGQPIGSRGTHTDVTERVMALQEQTKFVSLIENSSDFIAMATLDGVLLSLNAAGRKLVGLERVEEVTTSRLPDFMPTAVWEWMQQGVLPIIMSDGRWEGECQLVNVTTGKAFDMQASFFLIRDPVSGEPMCLATVQRDITEAKWRDGQLKQYVLLVQDQNLELDMQRQQLEAANAHLAALATTDGLTGAKNHRAFQDRLSEEVKRTERVHEPFSVILLDVDNFKQFNDQFGHPEGDRVLKQVVQVLQEKARESNFVARYGGEEFVILLPETGADGALAAAERFRAAIEAQEWPLRQITASFGVATRNATTQTAQQLVDLADKAMYASKTGGRNRCTHADAIPVSQ